MKLENVLIIFRKEFLDVLRDRRTILSMILLPMLVFPVLMIGLGGFAGKQVQKLEAKSSPIIVIGGDRAPELLAQLQQNPRLQVIPALKDTTEALRMLADHVIKAIVIIPPGFQELLRRELGAEDTISVQVLYDESQMESGLVLDKVRKELTDFRETIIKRQLEERNLPSSIVKPFWIMTQNLASESQMGGMLLGMFLPYIVILLTLTSATYPAIDLTAGEKERGTMETLLVSPASRSELVLGKFLTTMLVSIISAFLSVLSLFVTFQVGGGLFAMGIEQKMQFALEPAAFGMLFLLLVPLAALFASLLIAIAVNARSYKEAQSYVYPLIILAIIPAIASLMPGMEADQSNALIPVVNVSLVLRGALSGTYDTLLILMTFLSSIVYAAAGLFVAVRIFQKENVLLRI